MNSESRLETLRLERIMIVRLNRPDKYNAIDGEMTRRLDNAFNELEDDPDLDVGILSCVGENFSAGTDILVTAGEPTERGGKYGLTHRVRTKPLIAAVEGIAYGGGFELALACDMIVCGESSKFALPEVRHSFVANAGALFRAPRALPVNLANQMLLTGTPLSSDRAYQCGVVNSVVEDGTVETESIELAMQVMANSPSAIRATMRALSASTDAADEAGWRATRDAENTVLSSADFEEGRRAFREKRRPIWNRR